MENSSERGEKRMTLARKLLLRGISAVLVPFAVLYGANWLIFHPEITAKLVFDPPFEPTRTADAIVVLAGEPERVPYAASLVERGLAPRILSTLVDAACLRERGVRDACRTGVRNTIDEALTMRRILAGERLGRVMIVTSRYHAVRTAALFAVVFLGTGIEVNVVVPPIGASRDSPSVREVLSFFPSLGGAVIGLLAPDLYEWVVQRRPSSIRQYLGLARRQYERIAVPA